QSRRAPCPAWPLRSCPRRRPEHWCPRRSSWGVVVQLVTPPAADIHRPFCSEPREKGGASPLCGPLVLGDGRDLGHGFAMTRHDDAAAPLHGSQEFRESAIGVRGRNCFVHTVLPTVVIFTTIP